MIRNLLTTCLQLLLITTTQCVNVEVEMGSMEFTYGDSTSPPPPSLSAAAAASTFAPCDAGFKECRRSVFHSISDADADDVEAMRKGAAALRCKFLEHQYTSDVVKMTLYQAELKDPLLKKQKHALQGHAAPFKVRMNPKAYVPYLRPNTCASPSTPITCAYIALLILGESAIKTDWDDLFGAVAVDFLASQGAIALVEGTAADYQAVVQIWPVDTDIHIATDMTHTPFRDDAYEDVMYIGGDSEGLVHNAPIVPATKILDLCTGSGIQAIAALRYYAEEAVLVDVNPRAVRFARFNLLLNGLDERGEVREGNLYAALTMAERDEGFDAVLANPPFIPAPTLKEEESSYHVVNPNEGVDGARPMPFYGDGGNDGERVMEAIVSGAGAVLKEGGRLLIVADLMDPFNYDQKLEVWLAPWSSAEATTPQGKPGPAASTRSEAFTYHGHFNSAKQYAKTMSTSNDGSYAQWKSNMKKEGIHFIAQGFVFIFKGPVGGSAMKIHPSTRVAGTNVAGTSMYPFVWGMSEKWPLPSTFAVPVSQTRRWPTYSYGAGADSAKCAVNPPGDFRLLTGTAEETHAMRLAKMVTLTQEAYAEQSRVTETGVFAATVEWWDREGEAEGPIKDAKWRKKKKVKKILKRWSYKKSMKKKKKKKKSWWSFEL